MVDRRLAEFTTKMGRWIDMEQIVLSAKWWIYEIRIRIIDVRRAWYRHVYEDDHGFWVFGWLAWTKKN